MSCNIGKVLGLEEKLNSPRHPSQITFFCGHDPKCLVFNSIAAAQLAKKNVERYYAVVGVLEEMKKSIRVFEMYIPKFFNNASKTYEYILNRTNNEGVNKNVCKPQVPTETLALLRHNFSLEIDFYQFCKSRLHKQYLILR